MPHFRTHDLSLAATLLHEKCPLVDIDKAQPRAEFVFENSEELTHAVSLYWRDELLCPAQSLLGSFRKAKHILYDGHI